MKRTLFSIAVLLAFALAGCRREDVRTLTLELPGISPQEANKISAALSPYSGVKKDSFRWDFARGTLTLAYDSMQIAGANIRMAIEETGVRVVWPKKTEKRAGH